MFKHCNFTVTWQSDILVTVRRGYVIWMCFQRLLVHPWSANISNTGPVKDSLIMWWVKALFHEYKNNDSLVLVNKRIHFCKEEARR